MIYFYRFIARRLERTGWGRGVLRVVAAHRRQVDTIESFAIALLLAAFIVTFIVEAFQIPTGSMKDTLLEGDRIFVNKFLYPLGLLELKRGDIVVFRTRNIEEIRQRERVSREKQPYYIKRVVALAGDTVRIEHGRLLINGRPLDDPPIFADNTYLGQDYASMQDQYWPHGELWPEGYVRRDGDKTLLFDAAGRRRGVFVRESVRVPERKMPATLRDWGAALLRPAAAWPAIVEHRVVDVRDANRTLYTLQWIMLTNRGDKRLALDRVLDASGTLVFGYRYQRNHGGRAMPPIDVKVYDRDGVCMYRRVQDRLSRSPYVRDYVVPEGHLMLMGDNSLSSLDSRYWGPVPMQDVVGRAFFRFWPLHRIGFIRDRPTPEGAAFRRHLAARAEAEVRYLPPDAGPPPALEAAAEP